MLAGDLLERLASSAVDFTIFFRRLCACATDPAADANVASLFADPKAFHDWALAWRERIGDEAASAEERAAANGSVTSSSNSMRNSESPKLCSNMPAASMATMAASAAAASIRC